MDKDLGELWKIVKKLRGPQGCPWDREQDHKSLLPYLIEEVYEIANAIEKNNNQALREELGDLLFMIFSYISIGEEKKIFDLKDVIENINKKMIERHPHVFANKKLKTANQVLRHWHKIKDKEKIKKKISLLDDIPKNVSALIRAKLIQERASRVGFDWEKPEEAFLKIKEEIQEIKEFLNKPQDIKKLGKEIGDLLFAIVNVSRLLKIDPEIALRETIQKFIQRFKYIEEKTRKDSKSIYHLSLEEMETLWQESKKLNP